MFASLKASLHQHKQYLLTGVSYVVPLIACGGIMIALAIAMAPMGAHGPDIAKAPESVRPLAQLLLTLGGAAFTLMGPVLAAFIAYGMANKPGLAAGFVGGAIATTPVAIGDTKVSAGFLGALVAGLLAGHAVKLCIKIKVPRWLKPVMPILVIPILSTLVVGAAMTLLNHPLAGVMAGMGEWLKSMQSGSAVMLALVLGGMIAFDMGGPVNKAAFFFASGMLTQGNSLIMGAVAVAICVPPIGLGLSTVLARKLWSEQDRDSGMAALGMGLCGITEGAIPFAAGDPFRVIPAIMAGSMTGAVIAMLAGAGDHAPHGGLIVLPVVDNRVMYVVAIAAGSAVTAGIMTAVKWRDARKAAAVAA